MVVLRVILGILIIAASFYCIAAPGLAVTALCWVVASFMFVAGIATIAFYIEAKNKEIMLKKAGMPYVGVGIGCLIFGIVGVILAIKALSSPTGTAVMFKVISILFGLSIIAKGAIDTYFANVARKLCAPGWLASMILGILVILCGIFCIINSFYSMVAMGSMIGMAMMMFGFAVILGPVDNKAVAVKEKKDK